MSLVINDMQRKALREIFEYIAGKEGKLDKAGLEEIFKLIDYKTNEKQMAEFNARLFNKKEKIGFDDFLKIFNLKMTDYTTSDVKNAFRLIAKDDDKWIPLAKIKKILEENGVSEIDVVFLTSQLQPFTDPTGKVNYPEFLKSLSIY